MTKAIKQAAERIEALIESSREFADDDYICGLQAAVDIVYDADRSKPDTGFEEAQRLMLAALEEKREALLSTLGMRMFSRPIVIDANGAQPIETPEQQATTNEVRAALHTVLTMEGIVSMLGLKDDGKRLTYTTPAPLQHIESLAVHAWLTGFQAGKNVGCEAVRENPCGDHKTFKTIEDARPPAKVEILRMLNLVTQYLGADRHG